MQNIEMSEIENCVHRWVNQLSMSAARKSWGYKMNGETFTGWSKIFKKDISKCLLELLLEDNQFELSHKLCVIDETIKRMSSEVDQNDFPKRYMREREGKSRLTAEGVIAYFHEIYNDECDVHNDVRSLLTQYMSKSLPKM